MKKLILGGLLFAMGMLGVIAMIAAAILASSQIGVRNLWDFIFNVYGNGTAAPFIFFCLMSLTGLAFFVAKPIKEFVIKGYKYNPSSDNSKD